MNKGKLIVLDGTDGSGKATQVSLLAENLLRAGYKIEVADFPQYKKKSAGLVEEYLSGKYGAADQVGPYRASIFYAADRYDASFRIREWLSEGKIVISDRYVTANLGHQGAKISDPLERKHFFDWLLKLEYEIFNIPRPDLNIILQVPAGIAQDLVKNRQLKLNQALHLHEDDLTHLKRAEQTYLEITRSFPDMVLIECVKYGRLLDRETIKNLIWQEVAKLLNHSPGGSGLDLFSVDYYSLPPGRSAEIQTDAQLDLAPGRIGLILNQENLTKQGIHAMTSVFDCSLNGRLKVVLVNLSQDIFHIAPGQKVGRLLIQRQIC